MNKRVFSVILIFIGLFLAVWISLRMNQPTIEAQKKLLENAALLLVDGDQEFVININDLKGIGEEVFEAVLDTSSTDPSLHTYHGVQLKNILTRYQIALEDKAVLILSGADSYAVAYGLEEVLADQNVYIAFMEDGNYLGSKENGGRGPYESIVVSDPFSNRRCKWLTKVEVRR
ncbi:molybdopterin-dependent oxidoreductase [Geosporobacter ferrireducens]|uniref:Uncharacterized protein n=1 Tax=Geosporobacter ferrireducens TaxID=1424294 RepID=A0A1D8GF69_9FIRM|nr:molybdopterin-dependent oxidoreductase [Geosporobacter ferrireducens]AOT69556.1 hypothetical protein Gferi_08180 [Geosporobacter ferrireducens]MTI54750.1 hypothetical protein [Geosporobacter ferrireducens]